MGAMDAKANCQGNRIKLGVSHRKEPPPRKCWAQTDAGKHLALNVQKQKLWLGLD